MGVLYLFLMLFPQPGWPEGVLTFSIKECVRVARPSGSPAVAGRFPRPIWAGFPTSKIQIPNSKNQTIPKFKIQNLKYKVQNPKYKIQHPKSKKSKSISKTPKVKKKKKKQQIPTQKNKNSNNQKLTVKQYKNPKSKNPK